MIWIDKFSMTFFMIQENAAYCCLERDTETLLGQTRACWDGFSVPALILIIQQHTSDNAAQMPELQTQVLSGLVLIAANWCSNTSRHMWRVCINSENRGDCRVFQCQDYKIIQDKRTDCYQNSSFHSQKIRHLSEQRQHQLCFTYVVFFYEVE